MVRPDPPNVTRRESYFMRSCARRQRAFERGSSQVCVQCCVARRLETWENEIAERHTRRRLEGGRRRLLQTSGDMRKREDVHSLDLCRAQETPLHGRGIFLFFRIFLFFSYFGGPIGSVTAAAVGGYRGRIPQCHLQTRGGPTRNGCDSSVPSGGFSLRSLRAIGKQACELVAHSRQYRAFGLAATGVSGSNPA